MSVGRAFVNSTNGLRATIAHVVEGAKLALGSLKAGEHFLAIFGREAFHCKCELEPVHARVAGLSDGIVIFGMEGDSNAVAWQGGAPPQGHGTVIGHYSYNVASPGFAARDSASGPGIVYHVSGARCKSGNSGGPMRFSASGISHEGCHLGICPSSCCAALATKNDSLGVFLVPSPGAPRNVVMRRLNESEMNHFAFLLEPLTLQRQSWMSAAMAQTVAPSADGLILDIRRQAEKDAKQWPNRAPGKVDY